MALFRSKKPPSPTADNTLPMHGDKGKTRLPDSCYQSEGDGLHVLYTLLRGNEAPKVHDAYIYNGAKVISLQFLFSYFDEPIGEFDLMDNRW